MAVKWLKSSFSWDAIRIQEKLRKINGMGRRETGEFNNITYACSSRYVLFCRV
jgi:hypothetical protein